MQLLYLVLFLIGLVLFFYGGFKSISHLWQILKTLYFGARGEKTERDIRVRQYHLKGLALALAALIVGIVMLWYFSRFLST